MFLRQIGMTRKALSRFCANSPTEASRVRRLGDLGYRRARLAKAGEALGITVEAIPSSDYSTGFAGGTLASLARGRDGCFVPAGICWATLPKVPRARSWNGRGGG